MLIAPIALRSWLIKQIYRILICIYLLLPHFKCTLCDENPVWHSETCRRNTLKRVSQWSGERKKSVTSILTPLLKRLRNEAAGRKN